MGWFNLLSYNRKCSNCGEHHATYIQFEYGFTRLLEYQMGDKIKWDGSIHNIGNPTAHKVKVLGLFQINNCPSCGYLLPEYINILIESRIIKTIAEFTEKDRSQYLSHNSEYIEDAF